MFQCRAAVSQWIVTEQLREGGPKEKAFVKHLPSLLSLGHECLYSQPQGRASWTGLFGHAQRGLGPDIGGRFVLSSGVSTPPGTAKAVPWRTPAGNERRSVTSSQCTRSPDCTAP